MGQERWGGRCGEGPRDQRRGMGRMRWWEKRKATYRARQPVRRQHLVSGGSEARSQPRSHRCPPRSGLPATLCLS